MTASEPGLPEPLDTCLRELVGAAQTALGDELVSVVLFGSGAEGKLRASSDLNLMLVLKRFDAARIDRLREPLRGAQALIRVQCMLILESELTAATESFAVKFADIGARHRVLWGADVVAALHPSRDAVRLRLRQVLLNFILRTRERYALTSLREEQLVPLIADAAAPLRAAAAMICELEGKPASSPKAALETVAMEIGAARHAPVLEILSQAREQGALEPGVAGTTMLGLLELAQALRERAETL